MVSAITKFVAKALVAWLVGQAINTAFEPFIERPRGAIRRNVRWLALKLRLAIPEDEEASYAMA